MTIDEALRNLSIVCGISTFEVKREIEELNNMEQMKSVTQILILQVDWDKLTAEQKELVKGKCANLQIVTDAALEEIKKQDGANVMVLYPRPKPQDFAELLKSLKTIYDNDRQEKRNYDREQMRNRMRYMNKHQRYPKK